jgi:outer membrane protein assembly factor BamB
LVAVKNSGLYLKSFDLANGKPLGTDHIFGQDYLGNIFHPSVIGPDGTLFIGYNKLPLPAPRLSLLAYGTTARKLLWTRDINLEGQKELMSFRHIMRSDNNLIMVATIRPNRFVVFDSKAGEILRDARLANYIGWSDDNAALYSYPYLYTGARRRIGNGMAFDLIALNLETGKVDWSYQIDTQSQYSTIPKADILNFVVGDDRIYIGRADARIMSFSQGGGASPGSK